METYLIRHGQSTGDVEDRYGGDYDDHLTEHGKAQSTALAQLLKTSRIQILYTSPRFRAAETAAIIGRVLRIPVQQTADLRERNNYGVLTGLPRAEAQTKFPAEVEDLLHGGLQHHVRGSEAYAPFKQRVVHAFQQLSQNSDYAVIGIVTHGGPINCIFRELLGREVGELADCSYVKLHAENGQLTVIQLHGIRHS